MARVAAEHERVPTSHQDCRHNDRLHCAPCAISESQLPGKHGRSPRRLHRRGLLFFKEFERSAAKRHARGRPDPPQSAPPGGPSIVAPPYRGSAKSPEHRQGRNVKIFYSRRRTTAEIINRPIINPQGAAIYASSQLTGQLGLRKRGPYPAATAHT